MDCLEEESSIQDEAPSKSPLMVNRKRRTQAEMLQKLPTYSHVRMNSSPPLMIRTVNASKNSKLRAAASDFDNSINSLEKVDVVSDTNDTTTTTAKKVGSVQPNLDKIQTVANLLNVQISTLR